MTFESLEAAQREAAYLKCKTCAEKIKAKSDCDTCNLYDLPGDCNILAMNKPLRLIETLTGEKCEIIKPVSEMLDELETYCDNLIPDCDNCVFGNIECCDGHCLIHDCGGMSDDLVKLLYDYYEKKMEEKHESDCERER